ncbi:MAG: 4Fe-4S dicluster domain-containing protein [Bacillota bacterium]
MKNYYLPVEAKDVNHTLKSFLERMLADGIAGALLAPLDTGSGKSVAMSLVKTVEGLKSANPLAPVAMVNSARLVSELTLKSSPGEKIGVILRSCESRALIELLKLNQASLENIFIIGIDCTGTFEPRDYREIKSDGNWRLEEWLAASASGEEEYLGKTIRMACRSCSHVETEHASIHLGWVGSDRLDSIIVSATGEFSGWLTEYAGTAADQAPEGRKSSLEAIRLRRKENKKKIDEKFSRRFASLESVLDELSGCIRCYNCRQACPLCFCRECVFSTDVFRHDSEYFMERAVRKEVFAMPPDKLLFHMTRINHMALGCVGCGQCESACPAGLPLGALFRIAGEKLQAIFDYNPGRSVDEATPLTTYREIELEPR